MHTYALGLASFEASRRTVSRETGQVSITFTVPVTATATVETVRVALSGRTFGAPNVAAHEARLRQTRRLAAEVIEALPGKIHGRVARPATDERYVTKAPRAERLTSPAPSPRLLPESAPGVPVLISPSTGREFKRLDKGLLGAARRIRCCRDPKCAAAWATLKAAREARQLGERDGVGRFALETLVRRESDAADAWLGAQLGL